MRASVSGSPVRWSVSSSRSSVPETLDRGPEVAGAAAGPQRTRALDRELQPLGREPVDRHLAAALDAEALERGRRELHQELLARAPRAGELDHQRPARDVRVHLGHDVVVTRHDHRRSRTDRELDPRGRLQPDRMEGLDLARCLAAHARAACPVLHADSIVRHDEHAGSETQADDGTDAADEKRQAGTPVEEGTTRHTTRPPFPAPFSSCRGGRLAKARPSARRPPSCAWSAAAGGATFGSCMDPSGLRPAPS